MGLFSGQFLELRQKTLPEYMNHAEWAFARWGLAASAWLSTREHYMEWLRRFKMGKVPEAGFVLHSGSCFRPDRTPWETTVTAMEMTRLNTTKMTRISEVVVRMLVIRMAGMSSLTPSPLPMAAKGSSARRIRTVLQDSFYSIFCPCSLFVFQDGRDDVSVNLMKKFMEAHMKDYDVKRHGGESSSASRSSPGLPMIETPKHYTTTSAALQEFTPTPLGVQTASRLSWFIGVFRSVWPAVE